MSIKLLEEWDEDLRFVFMNTGQEHEKTLEFIHKVDRHYSLNLEWIEAVVHHGQRKGSGFRVVDYTTASRKGEPFEEVIKKYGLPNKTWGTCNRELKFGPNNSWRRENGLTGAKTAIGIRADEFDRMSTNPQFVYPLISTWPTTKLDVLSFWKAQPFDLEIPEHLGNCTWCFKKSHKKLLMVNRDMPEAFDFPRRVERQYAYAGAPSRDGAPRRIFRENKTVAEITTPPATKTALFDVSNGCSESCELTEAAA
jgi:hypothetical protein